MCVDVRSRKGLGKFANTFSHIVTSPPYINAQDYFRNFKLELNLLEDLIPFTLATVRYKFIGTERTFARRLTTVGFRLSSPTAYAVASDGNHSPKASRNHSSLPCRYALRFLVMKTCLKTRGKLILVCGDNLVGGYRIPTWKVLNKMLEDLGFKLFDRFGDKIDCRNVPPKRQGHVGLIKQEVISAFKRS